MSHRDFVAEIKTIEAIHFTVSRNQIEADTAQYLVVLALNQSD
jgi:hypothetical protein